MKRNRFRQLLLISFTIIFGISSRKLNTLLPEIIVDGLGDILWALMFFWLFGFTANQKSTLWIAVLTLLFSFSIELSQLYHTPFIDSIRATTLGGLLLGYNFVWSDIVCYTIGVLMGVAVEKLYSA